MPTPSIVYARQASSTAQAQEVNPTGDPAIQLQFFQADSLGNLDPNGDLDLDAGLVDPDTVVLVNGEYHQFTFELAGFMPDTPQMRGLGLVNRQVAVITDAVTGVRYFFLIDSHLYANTDTLAEFQAVMDSIGNGRVDLINTDTVGPAVICFARGSRIETPDRGLVLVEQLCAGDLVICETGPMPIVWVGSSNVSYTRLLAAPHLRPIKIAPGAIGDNLPAAEVNLSPNHRVVLDNWRISLAIGSERALCPAKHLVNNTTITRTLPAEGVEYFHILVDGHHIVSCEGLPCETLFTGPIALQSLEPAAREELETLFPHLRDETAIQMAPLALPELKAHEARALG